VSHQTILLLCIGASFSFVLGGSDSEEDAKDPVIIEFAKQIYESLGKKPTSMISKVLYSMTCLYS
jgi:hypothetical protein